MCIRDRCTLYRTNTRISIPYSVVVVAAVGTIDLKCNNKAAHKQKPTTQPPQIHIDSSLYLLVHKKKPVSKKKLKKHVKATCN